MFDIHIYLYITSFSLIRNEKCFVSLSENIYTPIIAKLNNDNSIDECIQKNFEKYIKLGYGWAHPILMEIEKDHTLIKLHYAIAIPPDTGLIDSYYTSYNISIINRLARKSIQYV